MGLCKISNIHKIDKITMFTGPIQKTKCPDNNQENNMDYAQITQTMHEMKVHNVWQQWNNEIKRHTCKISNIHKIDKITMFTGPIQKTKCARDVVQNAVTCELNMRKGYVKMKV